MTLRALQADAQERLTDGPRHLLGRYRRAEEVDRPDLRRGPTGSDQLSHPLIVRTVLGELRAQPAVHFVATAIAEFVAVHKQHVGPPLRPVVRVLGAVE